MNIHTDEASLQREEESWALWKLTSSFIISFGVQILKLADKFRCFSLTRSKMKRDGFGEWVHVVRASKKVMEWLTKNRERWTWGIVRRRRKMRRRITTEGVRTDSLLLLTCPMERFMVNGAGADS